MNKRIFEMIQAQNGNRGLLWTETDKEEFAELIVRECMHVARGMRKPSNLNYDPSDKFVDELQLHFKVKE